MDSGVRANVAAAQICGFVAAGDTEAANELLTLYLVDSINGDASSACQALQDMVGALIGVAVAVAEDAAAFRELGHRLLGVPDA